MTNINPFEHLFLFSVIDANHLENRYEANLAVKPYEPVTYQMAHITWVLDMGHIECLAVNLMKIEQYF